MEVSTAAAHFFKKYEPKIKSLISRYPEGMYDDLMQESYLGIVRALEKSKYDNLTDTSFRNYIYPWVKHYVNDYYHKNKSVVTVSRRIKAAYNVEHKDSQIESDLIGTGDPSDFIEVEEYLNGKADNESRQK